MIYCKKWDGSRLFEPSHFQKWDGSGCPTEIGSVTPMVHTHI